MIPKHQLTRVRLQIYLPGEILHVVDLDVMLDEHERHDERNDAVLYVLDALDQLLADAASILFFR